MYKTDDMIIVAYGILVDLSTSILSKLHTLKGELLGPKINKTELLETVNTNYGNTTLSAFRLISEC